MADKKKSEAKEILKKRAESLTKRVDSDFRKKMAKVYKRQN